MPVRLDAVEVEEEDIEHTNVFADSSSTPAGESEDYESEDFVEEESAIGRKSGGEGRGGGSGCVGWR